MFNNNFIKKVQNLKPITKLTFTLGLICIFYSLISKLIPIYFFWESGFIGIILILFGIIFGLSFDLEEYNSLLAKIFKRVTIGIIILGLIAQSIQFMFLLDSEAYNKAIVYFKTDKEVKIEIGDINEITPLPMGEIFSLTNENGTMGNVELNFIIKGKKSYKRATVYLKKDFNTPWSVFKLDW